MKAAVPTLAVAPALEKSRASDKSTAAVLAELFKMRLTILVLLTTFVGFYAGWRGPMPGGLMLHTMLGTALLAAGASALNQFLERDYDAKMRRTQDRPLPSGRVTPEAALIIGGVCAGTGLIYLALTVNHLTALLGALTLGSYLLVYTPLKRITTLNTAVGAIPGALPPLMGWTAARGEVTGDGWSLFAILFFWQLPHFLAIAWMYRRGLRPGGIRHAAGGGPDWRAHGPAGLQPHSGIVAGELVPVFIRTGRAALFGGRAGPGGRFSLVRLALFAADQPGRRAALVLRLHSLSAAIIVANCYQ